MIFIPVVVSNVQEVVMIPYAEQLQKEFYLQNENKTRLAYDHPSGHVLGSMISSTSNFGWPQICKNPGLALNNAMNSYCFCKPSSMAASRLYDDSKDRFFKLTPTEKARNHEEFIRTEAIEELKLSKEAMYDMLLQPYKHEKLVERDELNQKATISYVCKYPGCDRLFTKGWNILDHIRMHEGLRPFQCEFCERAFTQK
mmetsp:Transcript_23931/g.27559  ORF Transcript_23931/g.27559 Transcript_23931/m.27559 type:complete len:199 (-) Transcript_23931:212-808(-)